MNTHSRRLSKKKFDALDTHNISRTQHIVYKRLFKESSNPTIEKICYLNRLISLKEKEYKYAGGKKSYDGDYTSKVSSGIIKGGQIRKLYLYFGLCFWIVVTPNAPHGFFKKKINCSDNFLKRNEKRLKIRARYFALAEKFPKNFETQNYLNQALVLLASCCKEKSLSNSKVKIKSKVLNELIRTAKDNIAINKQAKLM